MTRPALRPIAGCMGLALCACAPLFSAASPAPQDLPAPGGREAIGTTVVHLVDPSHRDFISADPRRRRELMVQLWYPADGAPRPAAPYFPDGALLGAMQRARYYGQSDAVIGAWKNARTHAGLDAAPAPGPRLPLLLFSHGLGVSRSHYTSLCEELASRGYLVAAIDHPDGGATALPDGRVLTTAADRELARGVAAMASRATAWREDASFVLQRLLDPGSPGGRLAGRIDPARVGMFGHSLGGVAALEACLSDDRFKACANLDGGPFGKVEDEGSRRPALVISSRPRYSDADLAARRRTRAEWERLRARRGELWRSVASKRKAEIYLLTIEGTAHMSFSDAPFVMPDTVARIGGQILAPARGLQIITAYLRAFFDRHLGGAPRPLLDHESASFPEVSIEVYARP